MHLYTSNIISKMIICPVEFILTRIAENLLIQNSSKPNFETPSQILIKLEILINSGLVPGF